jgi:hypothetical protein
MSELELENKECFLCLDEEFDTKEHNCITHLNCCKYHYIHKFCLYKLFLFYLNDLNYFCIPCPMCRSQLDFKKFFTFVETKNYFSLLSNELQMRFSKKYKNILKYNFNYFTIEINVNVIDNVSVNHENIIDENPQKISSKDMICFTLFFILVIILIVLFILTNQNK